VTLRDVAEHAGVHPATVSRALNPQTRQMVNADTLQRVLDSARELNYRTNGVARSLRTQRTSLVGFVIPDITNPLFPPIVRGVDDALEAANYASLIAYTGGRDEHLHDRLEVLRERGVDGLIVATARYRDRVIDGLESEGIPVVQVNRRNENKAIPSVVADDMGGTHAAVAHVVELGHTRIGYIAAPQTHSTGRARLAGFRAAARRAGLRPEMVAMARSVTIESGAQACASLLSEHPDLTAVIAANDLMALGCYDAIAAAGKSCPRDVSVVGFNDMPFADRLGPPLTTVHFDAYEMGAAAGQLLLRRLLTNGLTSSAAHLELETRLVIRGSTAPPR
jgi:LacI family transcriptional regulator